MTITGGLSFPGKPVEPLEEGSLSMIAKNEAKTAFYLYRFYDDQGDLLYVGISNDPWRRQGEHLRKKHWYPLVHSWAVTKCGNNWDEARAVERWAIKNGHPRFNIADAPAPVPVRFAVRTETVFRICIAVMTVTYLSTWISLWMPSWGSWLNPICVTIIWIFAVLVIAAGLTMIPTSIRRFGAWLEKHIVPMF